MKSLTPVVWREGMHLAQHHFQQRDRYFDAAAAFTLSSIFYEPYGLTGLELDDDALLNGTVSIVHARGVMPDGLSFSFPEDPPPPTLEIRERFSPTRESHVVLLAIPPLRPGEANCALDSAEADGRMRFRATTEKVPDETTGQDERPVTLGRKNFQLLLESSETDERVTLPLARIRRDRSGNFVYDREYVPPCLQIGASRRILELLRRLIDVMEAKSESLATDRTTAGPGSDIAPDEIVSFWLSHAIHSSLPLLRHHLAAKEAHPEVVYRSLLRLAGALSTFAMESHPRDLPAYDHRDLEGCFGSVDRYIRSHLDVILPKKAVRVALEPMDEAFYLQAVSETDRSPEIEWFRGARPYFRRGSVPDVQRFRDAHWFLEVRDAADRQKAVSDIPRLVKVCSARWIFELVQRAHSGFGLEHVSAPPAAVSPRLGAEYFRISSTKHPCWNSLRETGEVGVYAPGEVADLAFGLVIVPEE